MRIIHQSQPGIIRKSDYQADHVVDLVNDFVVLTGNVTIDQLHNGKIIRSDDLSGVVYTLPNSLPTGFNVCVIQRNAGQITFSPASGATLRSAHGFTKTYGRYAFVGLMVMDNIGGASAEWLFGGNGAP